MCAVHVWCTTHQLLSHSHATLFSLRWFKLEEKSSTEQRVCVIWVNEWTSCSLSTYKFLSLSISIAIVPLLSSPSPSLSSHTSTQPHNRIGKLVKKTFQIVVVIHALKKFSLMVDSISTFMINLWPRNLHVKCEMSRRSTDCLHVVCAFTCIVYVCNFHYARREKSTVRESAVDYEISTPFIYLLFTPLNQKCHRLQK